MPEKIRLWLEDLRKLLVCSLLALVLWQVWQLPKVVQSAVHAEQQATRETIAAAADMLNQQVATQGNTLRGESLALINKQAEGLRGDLRGAKTDVLKLVDARTSELTGIVDRRTTELSKTVDNRTKELVRVAGITSDKLVDKADKQAAVITTVLDLNLKSALEVRQPAIRLMNTWAEASDDILNCNQVDRDGRPVGNPNCFQNYLFPTLKAFEKTSTEIAKATPQMAASTTKIADNVAKLTKPTTFTRQILTALMNFFHYTL
jgi:hypothetical protein